MTRWKEIHPQLVQPNSKQQLTSDFQLGFSNDTVAYLEAELLCFAYGYGATTAGEEIVDNTIRCESEIKTNEKIKPKFLNVFSF